MKNEWLIDVLTDLVTYLKNDQMPKTAMALEDAIVVLVTEKSDRAGLGETAVTLDQVDELLGISLGNRP